jgi:hypothetical protein
VLPSILLLPAISGCYSLSVSVSGISATLGVHFSQQLRHGPSARLVCYRELLSLMRNAQSNVVALPGFFVPDFQVGLGTRKKIG